MVQYFSSPHSWLSCEYNAGAKERKKGFLLLGTYFMKYYITFFMKYFMNFKYFTMNFMDITYPQLRTAGL